MFFQYIILNGIGNWLDMHGTGRTTLYKIGAATLIAKHTVAIAIHMERTDRRMMAYLFRDVLEIVHHKLVSLP